MDTLLLMDEEALIRDDVEIVVKFVGPWKKQKEKTDNKIAKKSIAVAETEV